MGGNNKRVRFEKFMADHQNESNEMIFPLWVQRWTEIYDRDFNFPRWIDVACNIFGDGIVYFQVKVDNLEQWIELVRWWKRKVDMKSMEIENEFINVMTDENESIFTEALEYINEQYLDCVEDNQKNSFAKDIGTDILCRLHHGLVGKLIDVLIRGHAEHQEIYRSFNSKVWGI